MNTYILAAKRTAIGSFLGSLSTVQASRLGAAVIQDLFQVSGASIDEVQECLMGQVLTAGVGQAPARQSAIYAGLAPSVPCMTINKVCGSGLKAIMLACDTIQLGRYDMVCAGGQENMSLAPYLLPKVRSGLRLGPGIIEDSVIKDGLWDPYHNFHMGNAGEICAGEYNISREEQDAFAINSYKKAQKAQKDHCFDSEITTISVQSGKKNFVVTEDEEPGKVLFDKIPNLKPVFEKEGTITAANASKINDGAAACLLASDSYVKNSQQKPLARVIAQGVHAQKPEHFTTAPVGAIKNCLQNASMKLSDIDLFEINEAFSVVALAVSKELDIPVDKLNVHGGAVALGHPIGASGARILVTLVHALHRCRKKYGLASLCLGGGEAVSVLVERM